MAFQKPNPSNSLGSNSPHFLSALGNTMGQRYATNGTDSTQVGVLIVDPQDELGRVIVSADAAYASGESLDLDLTYVDSVGAVQTITLVTLDDTNVTAAGTFEFAGLDVSGIQVGSTIALVRTYTAGGTPADPAIDVVLQFS